MFETRYAFATTHFEIECAMVCRPNGFVENKVISHWIGTNMLPVNRSLTLQPTVTAHVPEHVRRYPVLRETPKARPLLEAAKRNWYPVAIMGNATSPWFAVFVTAISFRGRHD